MYFDLLSLAAGAFLVISVAVPFTPEQIENVPVSGNKEKLNVPVDLERERQINDGIGVYNVAPPPNLSCPSELQEMFDWEDMGFRVVSDHDEGMVTSGFDDDFDDCLWWGVYMLTGDKDKANSLVQSEQGSEREIRLSLVESLLAEYNGKIGDQAYQEGATYDGIMGSSEEEEKMIRLGLVGIIDSSDIRLVDD